jgi:hypothetical protein
MWDERRRLFLQRLKERLGRARSWAIDLSDARRRNVNNKGGVCHESGSNRRRLWLFIGSFLGSEG